MSESSNAPPPDLEAFIRQQVQARHDKLEKYCEAMLVNDMGGVLIDGDKVSLDKRVPWGEIYDITKVQDDLDEFGWRS